MYPWVYYAPKKNFGVFFVADYSDTFFMSRALDLARKGRGKTLPNPLVGAVIVKNGQSVGEGYHRGPGKPHAEVEAISNAGNKAWGATLFVNLEPCCHVGRTGPCTETIVKAGIKRVVYAATDPNPQVNGKGARTLRRAGIKVSNGLLSQEATRLNDVYFGIVEKERPFVTLKLAQSLDGKIAAFAGHSKWISCEESRKFVHSLRAEADAVLVGMGTVKTDNPQLTTRLVKGKNPYRIIVSTELSFPKNCKLIDNNKDSKTIIATSERNIKFDLRHSYKRGLTFWCVKSIKSGEIDLSDLLDKAKSFGIHSILIEGGASTATSFLKSKLVDKIIIITAPIIIGAGLDSIGDLGISQISQSISFKDCYRFHSGADEIFIGYPKWKE